MSDDKELKAREELEKRVQHYVGRGYAVISRTETTAQLVRKKRFSLLWCFLWFWTACIIYLFYHFILKKDKQVYLYIEDGKIKEK